MFIKLDGENIVGHDYKKSKEYNVEIKDQILVNSDGLYCYKYSKKKLVKLSDEEVNSHPLVVERNKNLYKELRAIEYSKYDLMFKEALAEKEEGRPEKMNEYLTIRSKIKQDIPKHK